MTNKGETKQQLHRDKPPEVSELMVDNRPAGPVHDLASLRQAAGQALETFEHETAITYFSQALAHPELPAQDPVVSYELLAGRAECYSQTGDLQAQAADLEQMGRLAEQMGDVARQVEVVNLQVGVANELGNAAEGRRIAGIAVALARQTGDQGLEANSLTALGIACEKLSDYTGAQECYEQARAIYQAIDDRSGEAHSLWDLGVVAIYTDRAAEARAYLEPALALYRELGDREGEANVLNSLGLATGDYAQQRAYYEQALTIFEVTGNRERQARVYNNLGLVYWRLGLYGQARHYGEQAVDIARDMQSPGMLSVFLESLGRAYLGLNAYDQARQAFEEGRALAVDIGDRLSEAHYWLGLGRVALAGEQSDQAEPLFKTAGDLFNELDIPGNQAVALAWLGATHLARNSMAEAYRCTGQAVTLLETADHASLEYPPQEVWWLHYQAQVANSANLFMTPAPQSKIKAEVDPVWTGLEQTREVMMAGIASLSDEGLRRNYLNKVEINHDIVIEWTRQAAERGLPLSALTEVARADDIQDQLKRMLDIGVRMTARRDPVALPGFIMAEVVELSGAERACLVLLNETGEREFVVISGVTPRQVELVKTQATAVLDIVRRKQQAALLQDVAYGDSPVPSLAHAPELYLRSVLGIPLISRSQLMGMIYADMRIINGRFVQADVDLLTVLANQAAAALENATWARTLEDRVAQRTAELQAANTALSHRTTELTTLNSISQALVSQLDLDALIELVGEKIRHTFQAQNVYIALYEAQTGMIHFPYDVDNGRRLRNEPIKLGEGLTSQIIQSKQPLLINADVEQHYAELGIEPVGTLPKSYLGVPIIAGDRAIGVISVQSIEVEGRFGEADLRLLLTIAAGVGVAIQNAQLYQETRRRAGEMATLAEVGREVSATLDLMTVLEHIVRYTQELLEADDTILWLQEPDEQIFRAIAAIGPYANEFKAHAVRFGEGIIGSVAQSGVAEVISHVNQDPRRVRVSGTPEEDATMLCAPLQAKGQTIGLMSLYRPGNNPFNQTDLDFFVALSRQVAIAIENARLFEETQHAKEVAEAAYRDLSEALENLKATQHQLVEAEKMAALGGLVAGVAHEINTPVGIGVTAASLLEQKTATLSGAYQTGQMKRSDLEKYLDLAAQSSHMILSNLNRASELIQSFKQVAVDQSSEERRTFAVKAYLEEVLVSLNPKLKQTRHTIRVNGDDTLTLDSYPGAFAQIATNLIMNSIIHAYEPDEPGQLSFDLKQANNTFILEYADDGRGIPAEHLSKIFDPFFTTKRGQGGSGLGLHIIYNLVTQKLGGAIRSESQVGQGTRFVIEIPLA